MAENAKTTKAPAKPRKAPATKTVAAKTDTKKAGISAKNGKTGTKVESIHRSVSQDEVARLAHRFWTERGGDHGHHEDDWFRAEQELLRGKAS